MRERNLGNLVSLLSIIAAVVLFVSSSLLLSLLNSRILEETVIEDDGIFNNRRRRLSANIRLRHDSIVQSDGDALVTGNTSPRGRRRLELIDDLNSARRPKIWTYYEKARTDMTDEADDDLLKNWRNAWYDAGWDPRICTLDDAKSVDEYEDLIRLIVDPNFIGEYNMQCYIRWIAMAGVGGGWLVDYDTFPLNHFLDHGRFLPNDGVLTIYANFVPALVSGSAHEYIRLAKRIGESMHKKIFQQRYINEHSTKNHHKNQLPWSDMMALKEIHDKYKDIYIAKMEVLSGELALKVGHDFEPDDCKMTEGMRAVHFSHRAIEQGNQVYRGAIHRGTVARKFLNMWNARCPKTSIVNIPSSLDDDG